MPPKRTKRKKKKGGNKKTTSDPMLGGEFANMSLNERKKMAVEAKNMGNQAFASGKTREAVSCFTDAIELDPTCEVYFSNRSAAYLKFIENIIILI